MTTQTWWIGNGQTQAQVDTIAITAVANGANFNSTINGKIITYVASATDTASSVATNWAALLGSALVSPEFKQVGFVVNGSSIVCTAATPGTPFTMTTSASGGGALTQTHTTANSSPSDAGNAANWLRNNVPSLPQNGDDVIVANSSIPILWNVNALAAVNFNSFTRWQSMTGQIGLPAYNPLGYWEYRPTYFQFSGAPLGNLAVLLGQGSSGVGPSLEQYNVGSQQATFIVRKTGSPSGTYAVRLLGSNGSNVIQQTGGTVAVARQVGEAAALASAVVDGGGVLSLGNITWGASIGGSSAGPSSGAPGPLGVVTGYNATIELLTAPASVILDQGSAASVPAVGLSFPSVIASASTRLTWLGGSGIVSLVLQTNSILDKSGSVEPMTIGGATIDATCQVLDPNNAITWQSPAVINGAITNGIFMTGRGRKVQIV
jgi:hypothetical protein